MSYPYLMTRFASNAQYKAVEKALTERDAQDEKWGKQKHDAKTWLPILVEEVGELAQAILHDEFGGKARGTMEDELIQATAVCLRWLEDIEENKEAQT